jgi:hypothetical protein
MSISFLANFRNVGSLFVGAPGPEGVEASATLDVEIEAVSGTGIADRDGQHVLVRAPEQPNVNTTAVSRGEFPAGGCGVGGVSR